MRDLTSGAWRACRPAAPARRAGAGVAGVLGALVLLGLVAQPAAADYTVWSCRGPDGAPVSAAAWQSAGTTIDRFDDTCATGGALTVTVPDGQSGTHVDDGGYRFQATAGSRITGYELTWSAMTAGGTSPTNGGFYAAITHDDFGFSGASVARCYATEGCTAKGVEMPWDAPVNVLVSTAPVSWGSISIAAGCSAPIAAGSCPDAAGSANNAQIRLYRARLTLADATPPTANGPVVGLPPAGTALTGVQTLAVPLADVGAGVQGVTAMVDGTVVDSATVPDCREPYTRATPCPESTTLGLAIDTTGLTNGSHDLQLVARDGAGNAATVLARSIDVHNAPSVAPDPPAVIPPVVIVPPPVLVPPPVAAPGDVVVKVATTRLSSERAGTLSGQVVRRDGSPLADAVLALETRPFGTFSDTWTTLRLVTADASGRFSVPAGATPRQLRLRLVPTGAASTTFVSDPVSVYATLRIAVRRSAAHVRNGRAVTLTGRLIGAGTSAQGKEVLVEAIVGGRWQAVGRVRANAAGAVRWTYRFVRTTREARYSFRMRVVRDSVRWPWTTIGSKRVKVLVVP